MLDPGIELGSKAWWQEPIPTEPSPWPYPFLHIAFSLLSLHPLKPLLLLIQFFLLTVSLLFAALSMEFDSCLLVGVSYDNSFFSK